MSLVKIAPAGDRAVLVELGEVDAAELHAAAAAMRARADVRACIVGHSSLYVIFDSHRSAAACCRSGSRQLAAAVRAPAGQQAARSTESSGSKLPHSVVHLRVSFREEYGPDLALLGVPRDEFFARVRDLRLVVRYIGFRGGFGYLDGWPPEWSMPRRPTSRPRVAAGTFAVAGSVAGFYPLDSPGGWNLLGRTEESLTHALAPGDQIEIEPTMDVMKPVLAPSRPAAPSFPLRLIQSPLATLTTAEDWSGIERGLPPG